MSVFFFSFARFSGYFYTAYFRVICKNLAEIYGKQAQFLRAVVFLFFVCSFYVRTLVVRSSWLRSLATAFVVPSFLAELPSANACRSSAYRSELLSELPKRRLDLRSSLSRTLAAFFVRKMLQGVLSVP